MSCLYAKVLEAKEWTTKKEGEKLKVAIIHKLSNKCSLEIPTKRPSRIKIIRVNSRVLGEQSL